MVNRQKILFKTMGAILIAFALWTLDALRRRVIS
jgi:hypothetical protein